MLKASNDYYNLKYKTPNDIKNKFPNSKILVIGNGYSTGDLIKYKDKLKNYFDAVIGTNWAIRYFEKQMDVFLATEKQLGEMGLVKYINRKTDYKKNIMHFINYRAINQFRNDIDKYKITRYPFVPETRIQDYMVGEGEGLIKGPATPHGLSAGTVMMQGIHLASIFGAKEIYLVGSELMFKHNKSDHYYKDDFYYTSGQDKKDPVVMVKWKGQNYKSTEFFSASAKFIDKLTREDCQQVGIKIFDFSDGLLEAPTRLKMEDFFK